MNTFYRNSFCVATLFATDVAKKENSYYNTSFAYVITNGTRSLFSLVIEPKLKKT